MTSQADFKRRVRERMARTGESYTTARAHLLRHGTLHVTNGDSTVMTLAQLGIDALAWRDALHEGPVLPGRPDLRAQAMEADVEEWHRRDAALERHHGDIVLWFEADLYDQLQIAEILARLHGRDVALRQIGEHVGIAHFGGLGELQPEQLAALPQVELSHAAIDYGARAYAALTSADPMQLLELGPSSELRFMREALARLAQEYPSTRDGLSLSERRLLAAAPGTREQLFQRAWRKEARPFMGDTIAFKTLDRLAPLLEDATARERVLAGELDYVGAYGIDRWIGGVHLQGHEVPYRWDDARETLVRS
ncbi:hypothetical protein [Solirubrobacter soli]|uniref:hypothetical protein n=1 Tax=Solirubrobacter soli TaxID=363832 RepID=UPI0003F6381A|nr:hypothetical protein [Solirubrobacter soli]